MVEPSERLTRRPLPGELARLLHDLRGPLNSAVVHLEVIKRAAAGDPALADSVRAAMEQLARLGEMLPAAFGVIALEARVRAPVALRGLVASVLAANRWRDVVLAPAPWPSTLGDATLLAVAVEELVRNALEATKPGARPPRVEAVADGSQVRLTVRDWGVGVCPTPQLLIRLKHSPKPGHHGIGLLVVERVARLHGGMLAWTSLGDGTQAALTLPRVDGENTSGARRRSPTRGGVAPKRRRHRRGPDSRPSA